MSIVPTYIGVGRPDFNLGEIAAYRQLPEDANQDYVNSTLTYIGYAITGASSASAQWRIAKIVSVGGQMTTTRWANGLGNSNNIWDDTTPLTITGITNASPGVVTVASTAALKTGMQVILRNIVGMTQANNVQYTIIVINGTTFSIGVDTTTFTAYGSAGNVQFPEYINYAYS